MSRMLLAAGAISALALALVGRAEGQSETPLPAKFDLRAVGAVTPIKQQQGGTCWTHGTMAAIESNLLCSGTWKRLGMKGEPALSEYHLDWWNGFNKHKNDDVTDAAKDPSGLKVHVGGDYRVAAAYISRGDGAVLVPPGKDDLPDTRAWYKEAPPRRDPSLKRLYVRDIEWFVLGDDLQGIDAIKRRIMTEGAIGTAYCVSGKYMTKDFVHYQAKNAAGTPNHAVAIVGWDDAKIGTDPMPVAPKPGEAPKPGADVKKAAPKPGAWLIKNSWGTKKGDQGYYWISYYDKVCCRDLEMGAVSFRNIEPMAYEHVYCHDYHGWRDTMKNVSKAFNAYTAAADHELKAVSFYTAKDNVGYTVKIFRKFENGQLLEEAAIKAGKMPVTGFHTLDLDRPIAVKKGEKFYVYLDVTDGGQAIDRTSEIPVLLGQQKEQPKPAPAAKGPNGPLVLSKANAGESFYFDGTWKDLYEYRFENPNWATFDRSANFCMKALAVSAPAAK